MYRHSLSKVNASVDGLRREEIFSCPNVTYTLFVEVLI